MRLMGIPRPPYIAREVVGYKLRPALVVYKEAIRLRYTRSRYIDSACILISEGPFHRLAEYVSAE